ncbi:hypothetical protein [Victivallis vadensis]|uniref:hypothetical protein n=1 Tax=Victivallis vadensis TaxID=172901 RepID=UPI003CFC573D
MQESGLLAANSPIALCVECQCFSEQWHIRREFSGAEVSVPALRVSLHEFCRVTAPVIAGKAISVAADVAGDASRFMDAVKKELRAVCISVVSLFRRTAENFRQLRLQGESGYFRLSARKQILYRQERRLRL